MQKLLQEAREADGEKERAQKEIAARVAQIQLDRFTARLLGTENGFQQQPEPGRPSPDVQTGEERGFENLDMEPGTQGRPRPAGTR